ncbi:CPBP family glutamic-type intramembrane protease [Halorhabdus amylolytica]|uniref:CPBP family glutamic-type intramembrane protease n=1 Tax=Halorhabdus amylolytica TaxID=2559573 RepID=UPI0010AA8D63|nr:CPBP family intramembrane glutamic endopeptidase [Halorhabdus amylolytica]
MVSLGTGSIDRRWFVRVAAVGTIAVVLWGRVSVGSVDSRVIRDVTFLLVLPLAFGLAHGRRLGWRVDRRAIRNTVLLSAFVLPFYLVGSCLPQIRAYYPMFSTSAELSVFVPHAGKQFLVALANETYYRGLLCVGVRQLGVKAVFVSPLVYAFNHVGKPPIEMFLSGPTDVLFGAVDYHSRSILPSVVAHGCGLVLLDWLVLHDPLLAPSTVQDWLSLFPLPI